MQTPGQKYPRQGERLAPISLREILAIPLPARIPKRIDSLADLDESIWDELSEEQCCYLGQAVISRVREYGTYLPETVLAQRLPHIPEGLTLEDLNLDRRTHNALRRRWGANSIRRMSNVSIGDLLLTKGVGPRALVDFLTALEAANKQKKTQRHPLNIQMSGCRTALDSAEHDIPRRYPLEKAEEWRRLSQLCRDTPLHDDDPRLGSDVRAILLAASSSMGSLQDAISELTNRQLDDHQANLLPDAARTFLLRVDAMKICWLEDELAEIVDHVRPQRSKSTSPLTHHVNIYCRRFGWDGGGQNTLQSIADSYGITRERVRQITSKLRKVLDNTTYPFAPRLDETIAFINQHAPIETRRLEELLVEHRIASRRFRVEGIVDAAQALKRPDTVQLSEDGLLIYGTGRNHDFDEATLPKLITKLVRQAIQSWGATTIADLAAKLEDETSCPANLDLVTAVVTTQKGFSWLDEPTGWFWNLSIPKSRNRLLNYVQKILSVTGRIDVRELRAGISRHHRMKGFSPPRRVLLEMCRQSGGYLVEGTEVVADPPLDWGRVLADTEATMVLVLLEHGPVMRRSEFEELSLGLGINRATFYVYLDYSPLITRYARGVYGLIGADVSPDVVSSLISARTHSKQLVDYGWTNDGKVWIGYRLSSGTIANGVVSIPGALKHIVAGDFDLFAADSTLVGKLVAKETSAWGLGPFFRRRGGEPDDCLLLTLDLIARKANIAIGTEAILDEYIEL